MLQLSLIKGTSRDFQLQSNNPDGTPTTNVFVATDAIASRVWQGDDQPVLLTPTTTWLSAPGGTFQVTFNDADTAALEFGQYRIQTTAARSGRTAVLFDGFLDLTAAPGTGTLRPVYGSYADMKKYAKWITNLQDPDDLEGFADQRADAREWLDNIIVMNYRGGTIGQFNEHSTAAFQYGYAGPKRSLVPSRWMQDVLNGVGTYAGLTTGGVLNNQWYHGVQLTPYNPKGGLLLRPKVLRIVAFRAIAEVCLGQIGKGGDYASFGAMFRQAADSEVSNFTAELDINNDGLAEIAVPITSTNVLFT